MNMFTDALSKIRSLVSQNKTRFTQDGFDLDLTYITPNIIAMGFPSSGAEAIYRNKLEDVKQFLDSYHPTAYRVYNLCQERGYPSEKFEKRCEVFPFEDHNAPPMTYLLRFCKSVEEWLATHPNNVVAIHCKAGKGRTGLMISAFLLYSKNAATAEEALYFFDRVRTADGKGVTIPSQRRYVKYFEMVLSNPEKYNVDKPPVLLLNKVRMLTVPRCDRDGCCEPHFELLTHRKVVYTSRGVFADRKFTFGRDTEIDFDELPLAVCGDVKLQFYHRNEKTFHFWFNTCFVSTEEKKLTLTKDEIDKACKDSKHKDYDANFGVTLFFEVV
eukprot:ANDGO_00848.mRNA.1 Phosphatidylinositol 3